MQSRTKQEQPLYHYKLRLSAADRKTPLRRRKQPIQTLRFGLGTFQKEIFSSKVSLRLRVNKGVKKTQTNTTKVIRDAKEVIEIIVKEVECE